MDRKPVLRRFRDVSGAMPAQAGLPLTVPDFVRGARHMAQVLFDLNVITTREELESLFPDSGDDQAWAICFAFMGQTLALALDDASAPHWSDIVNRVLVGELVHQWSGWERLVFRAADDAPLVTTPPAYSAEKMQARAEPAASQTLRECAILGGILVARGILRHQDVQAQIATARCDGEPYVALLRAQYGGLVVEGASREPWNRFVAELFTGAPLEELTQPAMPEEFRDCTAQISDATSAVRPQTPLTT